MGLWQAARSYQRALRRAALYAAGGTLGALAVWGLIRMHQRSRQHQAAAAGGVPAATSAERPPVDVGAHVQQPSVPPLTSTGAVRLR